jgi:hypothetical protein
MSRRCSNQLCRCNCGRSACVTVGPRERRLVSAQSWQWRSSRTPLLHYKQSSRARSCIDLLAIDFLPVLAPPTPQVLPSSPHHLLPSISFSMPCSLAIILSGTPSGKMSTPLSSFQYLPLWGLIVLNFTFLYIKLSFVPKL